MNKPWRQEGESCESLSTIRPGRTVRGCGPARAQVGAEDQPTRHEVELQRPQPSGGGSGELAGWAPWSAALSFPPWPGLVTGEAGPGLSAGGEVDLRTPPAHTEQPVVNHCPAWASSRPLASLRCPLVSPTPLPRPPELEGTSVTIRVTPHCVEGEPEACPPQGPETGPRSYSQSGLDLPAQRQAWALVCSLLRDWHAKPCRLSPRVSHTVPHTLWGGFHTFLSFNQSS